MASPADRPDPADAGLPEHARRNRAAWNADADDYLARHGTRQLTGGMGWGTWFLPESELRVLGEVAGRDVLELGCGSAQWSIALARAGARRGQHLPRRPGAGLVVPLAGGVHLRLHRA
ncbi:MAG TPA: hypothetical protein VF880_06630 [Actinomycetes bacterium]